MEDDWKKAWRAEQYTKRYADEIGQRALESAQRVLNAAAESSDPRVAAAFGELRGYLEATRDLTGRHRRVDEFYSRSGAAHE
jgi:hypothetical protein